MPSRCSALKSCRDRFEPGLLRPGMSTNHYHDHGVPLARLQTGPAACLSVQRGAGVRGRAKKHGHFSSACRRAGEQRGRQDSNLRGDPNGFLVHRLNHSATTTGTCVLCPVLVQHWRLAHLHLASSVTQPRLQASPAADKTAVPTRKPEGRTSVRGRAKKHGHFSSACRRAGEQRGRQDSNLRGDPNGFLVHRLNHSARLQGPAVLCPVLVQHWRLALAPSQLSHPAETAS
ncbi:hypothetical protein G5714_024558 [Onychostoma macrolepis]|uniref:Uncharacterized protein n=1 Tax=Onychostoma macrolepis TaxID=369639 RepID=A0A7J6BHC2_9TELE|nr:hypothetical protein G5714_024558 [Onychostoma macrolepis]